MLIGNATIQFKEYSQGMDLLFPSRLDENIASDAPIRLVNRIVDELDISSLLSTYKGGGCPGYLSPYAAQGIILRLPEQCLFLS